MTSGAHAKRVLVGRIGRPYGVQGLVHVLCYAADAQTLAKQELSDEAGTTYRLGWVEAGIARLSVCGGSGECVIADRTAAEQLTNRDLFIARTALPEPGGDEYYLADLVGLEAFDENGAALGRVNAVHDYGAGASLEIGALIVPFTRTAVPEVDVVRGRLVVAPPVILDPIDYDKKDWDAREDERRGVA